MLVQFRRATVQNKVTGALEPASYRISKSGWLSDAEHEVVRTVGVRIEDMTGLTMAAAEELQVVNYGIGGHYEPHYDFAGKEETNAFKNLNWGNRIATTLFYVRRMLGFCAPGFDFIASEGWPNNGATVFFDDFPDERRGPRRRHRVSGHQCGRVAEKGLRRILVQSVQIRRGRHPNTARCMPSLGRIQMGYGGT